MPASYNSTRQIYHQLNRQLELVRFPSPWSDLRSGDRSFGTLSDADRALAQLQQQWREDDLIESGLLRQRDDCLVMAPGLRCGGPLLTLRAKKNSWPFEVVSARGHL